MLRNPIQYLTTFPFSQLLLMFCEHEMKEQWVQYGLPSGEEEIETEREREKLQKNIKY